MTIQFGNAPCSWGTIEGIGQGVPAPQMLDELVAAGYHGTELGDYGYMPTDVASLRQELSRRHLTMLGAYEGVFLRDPAAHAEGEERVLRTARQLAATADLGDPAWQPLLVLADEHSRDPNRYQKAGRIAPQDSLSEADWKHFAAGAERIARAVKEETGLRTVFHHHSAGYVETPAEISKFLELTDPKLVGLVFDTGHFLYGTGGSNPADVVAALGQWQERIWYVHFKDMSPAVAAQARSQGFNYQEAIRQGLFCELGKGAVPFADVYRTLQQQGYSGWITVEQDVLPGMGEPFVSAKANMEYLKGLGIVQDAALHT